MQNQSIKSAIKHAEKTFDSAAFRTVCQSLGIDDHWGYKQPTLKRTLEIQYATPARAAFLCIHHGNKAILHAKHFFTNTVQPYPSIDYAGTKKLWREFPLNLRTRLQPIFSCADQFEGIAEIEERFLLWEGAYNQYFEGIQQVTSLYSPKKAKTDFHQHYMLAFMKHWPELESILVALTDLDR
jgi:hypothetical protein